MLKAIKNKKQYEEALEQIYDLMQSKLIKNSARANDVEVLSILVKEYENRYYPIPSPHPISAIRFRMEQLGITEGELSKVLGYRSRKSEILSGKRKLSLDMIRRLNKRLRIPASVLIREY